MTCIKIHSIILSVTCHVMAWETFLYSYRSPHIHSWIFETLSVIFWVKSHLLNVECELYKNSLNNFICHLSWLEKLSPTHTHPLISIGEFLKPCDLLFFELEFLAWPTLPHPTPPMHDPPHPCMTHPTLPHPTPPLEQFWEEMGWISWGPSLCLPFGRQLVIISELSDTSHG